MPMRKKANLPYSGALGIQSTNLLGYPLLRLRRPAVIASWGRDEGGAKNQAAFIIRWRNTTASAKGRARTNFLNAATLRCRPSCPVDPSSGQREANLDPAGFQCYELLDGPRIVGRCDRGAQAACRPILIAPHPARRMWSRAPGAVRRLVVGDEQRPELAFALIIALSRHRLGNDGGGARQRRGRLGRDEGGSDGSRRLGF